MLTFTSFFMQWFSGPISISLLAAYLIVQRSSVTSPERSQSISRLHQRNLRRDPLQLLLSARKVVVAAVSRGHSRQSSVVSSQ